MGLDSLMGLEFVRRLSNTLQIAVPATVVFNYPTVKLLALHLLRRMQMEPVEEPTAKIKESAKRHTPNVHDGAGSDGSGDLPDISEEEALQALMADGQRSS